MSLTRQQAEDFWACADSDGNGKMTIKELKTAMITKYNVKQLSDADVAKIFSDIDKSGDSVVTKQEFLDEMVNKSSRSKELCQLFKEYDASGDGQLSKDEVGKVLAKFFKERDPQDILEEFFTFADTSKDGVITYKEFEAYFG